MTTSEFSRVFDVIIAFAGRLTPEGRIVEINQPAREVSGLATADVSGLLFWDGPWFRHDPELRENVRDATMRAARGEVVRFEADIIVSGGKPLSIDCQIAPHYDDDGSVAWLIPSATDISDQRHAEGALASAYETFATVVRSSPFGIVVVDADLSVSFMSEGAQDAFDTPIEDLVGRDYTVILRSIWPTDLAEYAVSRFQEVLATGKPFRSKDTTRRRKDRARIETYDWRLDRIVLPDRRYGVICHFYDLSERATYEAALHESEHLFRNTFENAAVGIAHVDPNGNWLRVNQSLCDILGYSKEELIKLRFHDVSHPHDLLTDITLLDEIINGSSDDYVLQKRYKTKDGRTIWANLTVGCVRKDDGSVDYLISVVSDITRQKEAEAQRDLLVNELNHRVKNLLATIQSVSSHTRRHSNDADDFHEKFAGRLQAISHAHDSIFGDQTGSATLKEIIVGQFEIYFPTGPRRKVCEGPEVRLDAAAANNFGIVIHELLTNAIKYGSLSTDPGYVRIAWSVEWRQDGAEVTLTWKEHEGPAIVEPSTSGFGSDLMQLMVTQSLQGELTKTFEPEGLRVEMRMQVKAP